MKKIVYLLIILPLLHSCSTDNENVAMSYEDSLMAVISSQEEKIIGHEESINSFLKGFNEIQENLDLIKEKENIILSTSKDTEAIKSKESQIVADIQIIYDLMNKNKKQLYSLQLKLKSSNLESKELNKLIARLTTNIETKDLQIEDLRTQLELLNVSMTNLNIDYKEVTDELAEKKPTIKYCILCIWNFQRIN